MKKEALEQYERDCAEYEAKVLRVKRRRHCTERQAMDWLEQYQIFPPYDYDYYGADNGMA